LLDSLLQENQRKPHSISTKAKRQGYLLLSIFELLDKNG